MKRTILVTGSTDGIGKQTALELAAQGNSVILHGRDDESCLRTLKEIKGSVTDGNLDFVAADFSSLNQVKAMSAEVNSRFPGLNVLINNAGVFEKRFLNSQDGYELTFAVNYLAMYTLTMQLLNLLRSNTPARIVNVSSKLYHSAKMNMEQWPSGNNYSAYQAYADSKMAGILFTYTLADKLKGDNITVNALHPGSIDTKLLQSYGSSHGASLEAGAETPVYLATSHQVEGITGKYFIDKKAVTTDESTYSEDFQQRLMELSEQWTGVAF